MPLKVQNTALMMNLLMAFLLALYFQKWYFMAFWDSKFDIPLAKKVGNTSKQQIKIFRLRDRVARPMAWQNFIIKLI